MKILLEVKNLDQVFFDRGFESYGSGWLKGDGYGYGHMYGFGLNTGSGVGENIFFILKDFK